MSNEIDPRRFAVLELRHEVENLVARYGMACDDRDIKAIVNMYTDDAYFGRVDGSGATGRQAIFDYYRQAMNAQGITYHWSHDRLVELDPDDMNKGRGIVFAHCEIGLGDTACLAGMRYNDRYRRENGAWKFAERRYQFLYFVPASQFEKKLTDRHRVFRGGQWQEADIPEALDSWKTWRDIPYSAV